MPTTSKGLARPGLTPLSNSGESKKDVLKAKIEPKSESEPRSKDSLGPQGERRSSSSSLGGESNVSTELKSKLQEVNIVSRVRHAQNLLQVCHQGQKY